MAEHETWIIDMSHNVKPTHQDSFLSADSFSLPFLPLDGKDEQVVDRCCLHGSITINKGSQQYNPDWHSAARGWQNLKEKDCRFNATTEIKAFSLWLMQTDTKQTPSWVIRVLSFITQPINHLLFLYNVQCVQKPRTLWIETHTKTLFLTSLPC